MMKKMIFALILGLGIAQVSPVVAMNATKPAKSAKVLVDALKKYKKALIVGSAVVLTAGGLYGTSVALQPANHPILKKVGDSNLPAVPGKPEVVGHALIEDKAVVSDGIFAILTEQEKAHVNVADGHKIATAEIAAVTEMPAVVGHAEIVAGKVLTSEELATLSATEKGALLPVPTTIGSKLGGAFMPKSMLEAAKLLTYGWVTKTGVTSMPAKVGLYITAGVIDAAVVYAIIELGLKFIAEKPMLAEMVIKAVKGSKKASKPVVATPTVA